MPTTYTHHLFGQKVLSLLPDKIREDIEPYIDYYNIGVHGPDILFYYRSFHHNPFNQYGVRVHHEKASVFFKKAMDVFLEEKCHPKARAYLAGFMTHFILDSTCHPYINKRVKETGVSHTEIETDLDSVLMEENGHIPGKKRKTDKIHPTRQKGRIIAPFYNKPARKLYEGLIWQKLIVDHVFRSRYGIKRLLAKMIRKLAGSGQGAGGVIKVLDEHFTKRKINPRNEKTIPVIKELIEGCEQECADMITELVNALEKEDKNFIKHPRLNRKFS